jgi:hypothetical protein
MCMSDVLIGVMFALGSTSDKKSRKTTSNSTADGNVDEDKESLGKGRENAILVGNEDKDDDGEEGIDNQEVRSN